MVLVNNIKCFKTIITYANHKIEKKKKCKHLQDCYFYMASSFFLMQIKQGRFTHDGYRMGI